MPSFRVETPHGSYSAVVERGILARAAELVPSKRGKVFVISSEDVWRHQGAVIERGLQGVDFERIFLPGGEESKRLAPLDAAADEMVRRGGDRTSLAITFGGGIVTDMGGFLAAIFMRGIPVIHAPTTLLAQVDAAIGGKTGVNLAVGKNLIGSFHQPLAVWIDPAALDTLPEREYRAGLFEIVKAGIIRDAPLFRFLVRYSGDVLARRPEAVDGIIAESVRIKAEVVSADERESGLRRILNLGHTFGHALEAETGYSQFLHGEAVAWGMKAATLLGAMERLLSAEDKQEILHCVNLYGPLPPLQGIDPARLAARLKSDKKTVQGRIHFVLPERIGAVKITADVQEEFVAAAIQEALAC